MIETMIGNSIANQCSPVLMDVKPSNLLILTREEEEIVPYGATVIRGGDRLVVLCDSDETAAVDARLDAACRKMKI